MKGKLYKYWILAAAVAILLPHHCLAEGKSGAKGPGKDRPRKVMEVEPSPPLSIQARLVNLQKNKNGGVASVVLDAASDIDMDEVTISVKLPPNVTFADGSNVFTQTVKLSAGVTINLPKELLVGKDGKHVIQLEASGTTSEGKPIHRGTAFRLLVGTQDSLPAVKDGAIEYQGAPDGGN